jgi:hypothetical protein
MSRAPGASPVPTSHIAPAAAFAQPAPRNGTGDDRGDAVGHQAAELLGSFGAGGKVDTREGFTDVERGPVARL